jgi:hypothetical protein
VGRPCHARIRRGGLSQDGARTAPDASIRSMGRCPHQVLVGDLRVGEHLRHIVDGTAGNGRAVEQGHEVVRRPAGQHRVEDRIQLLTVFAAVGVGAEPRIVPLGLHSQCGAEANPDRIVAHRDIDMSIGGWEGVVRGDDWMPVAEHGRHLAGGEVDAGLVGEQGDLAAEHRSVDAVAETLGVPLAAVEGPGDGVGGKHAGGDIRDRDAELGRHPAFLTGNAHHAAHALHDQVVGGAGTGRAGLAEAGDRGED